MASFEFINEIASLFFWLGIFCITVLNYGNTWLLLSFVCMFMYLFILYEHALTYKMKKCSPNLAGDRASYLKSGWGMMGSLF